MIVGLAGFGVTVSVIELVVTVAGVTQLALEVSLQVITSPLTGAGIVMLLNPVVPGIITAFLNQVITGEVPGLLFVRVNVAASPEHNDILGDVMEAV